VTQPDPLHVDRRHEALGALGIGIQKRVEFHRVGHERQPVVLISVKTHISVSNFHNIVLT
jgi:hypothetical protein